MEVEPRADLAVTAVEAGWSERNRTGSTSHKKTHTITSTAKRQRTDDSASGACPGHCISQCRVSDDIEWGEVPTMRHARMGEAIPATVRLAARFGDDTRMGWAKMAKKS